MNLRLSKVPARQGTQWVRSGIRTFFRQPMAMTGLFFLFLAGASVLSLLPVAGNLIALVLLPGVTAGFMAAAREADEGKFPMPWILIAAFRRGPHALQAMLTLGAIYAVAILAVLGLSALVDGGHFAKMYLLGGEVAAELRQDDDFLLAAFLATALYVPISMLFWHAPALVMWHDVSPIKSVFFSWMACKQNFRAMIVFVLTWAGVMVVTSTAIALVAGLVADPTVVAAVLMPTALLIAAMFFTSLYFTFAENFESFTGEIA